MGTPIGRIEQEFIFKSLSDEQAPCEAHGRTAEVRCTFSSADEKTVALSPRDESVSDLKPGEEVRVFFFVKNNYHTFSSTVVSVDGKRLVLQRPVGVYKNLQRKYERVKAADGVEVSFSMKGRRIELNFPKSEHFASVEPPQLSESFDPRRINALIKGFRDKIGADVSQNSIVMFRDRMPRSWEEKLVAKLGKILWIPSTEEDFPIQDVSPEDRIITRPDLIGHETEGGTPLHVVSSKLGSILWEKLKKGIYAELFCPILYNEYVVGYVYLANTVEKHTRITAQLVDYVHQFSKILCYSLVANGYFSAEAASDRRFEAPIIDISASGLLFAHPSDDLARELHIHADLDLALKISKRTINTSARIMRKLKDAHNSYFGVIFMTMAPEDFRFLFEFLYGKPFAAKYEMSWEGGSPPPALEL